MTLEDKRHFKLIDGTGAVIMMVSSNIQVWTTKDKGESLDVNLYCDAPSTVDPEEFLKLLNIVWLKKRQEIEQVFKLFDNTIDVEDAVIVEPSKIERHVQ